MSLLERPRKVSILWLFGVGASIEAQCGEMRYARRLLRPRIYSFEQSGVSRIVATATDRSKISVARCLRAWIASAS